LLRPIGWVARAVDRIAKEKSGDRVPRNGNLILQGVGVGEDTLYKGKKPRPLRKNEGERLTSPLSQGNESNLGIYLADTQIEGKDLKVGVVLDQREGSRCKKGGEGPIKRKRDPVLLTMGQRAMSRRIVFLTVPEKSMLKKIGIG